MPSHMYRQKHWLLRADALCRDVSCPWCGPVIVSGMDVTVGMGWWLHHLSLLDLSANRTLELRAELLLIRLVRARN